MKYCSKHLRQMICLNFCVKLYLEFMILIKSTFSHVTCKSIKYFEIIYLEYFFFKIRVKDTRKVDLLALTNIVKYFSEVPFKMFSGGRPLEFRHVLICPRRQRKPPQISK